MRILILTGVVITLCTAQASAYTYRGVDAKISATAVEAYDDNVTYVKDNTKRDLVTNLTLGGDFGYETKNGIVRWAANMYNQIFGKYTEFNTISGDANASITTDITRRDRIVIGDVFSYTYEPRSFEQAFGITPGRYSYFRNRLEVGYTHNLTKQWDISGRYAYAIDLPSRSEISASYLNTGGVQADYTYSSSTLLSASYDFSFRIFSPGKDAATHTVAGGARQYLTKQFYLEGKAGFDAIRSYTHKLYVRPLISASATSEMNERTRAVCAFSKELYTNAYEQDLFDYWQLTGLVALEPLRKLAVSFMGFYGEGTYIVSDITANLFGATTRLVYEFSPTMQGIVSYSYSLADSNDRSREYNKNYVYTGVRFEF